jgi:hypothetical protein
MTTQNFTVGQEVKYSNGSPAIYTGIIMQMYSKNQLVIIDKDNKAGFELWNAGYSVGSCIHPNQIK